MTNPARSPERAREDEQAFWREVLDRRVKRFSKLVALNAPSWVLCSDLALLNEAVAGLYPEAYGQVYAEQARKAARIAFGRCRFCGAAHERDTGEQWCERCEAQAKADAEAADEAEEPTHD